MVARRHDEDIDGVIVEDLAVVLYRLRRLALLRRKWQPVRIVAFGAAASTLVREWVASPFEDPSIHAVASASTATLRPAFPNPAAAKVDRPQALDLDGVSK